MSHAVGMVRRGGAALLSWWIRELVGLLPRRLRSTAPSRRCGLVVTLGRSESSVLQWTSEGERVIGKVSSETSDRVERLGALLRQTKDHGRPVTIRLSAELGLCKVLDLPLAARDDLHQLLRFEMDRLTPFHADEVCFAQRVLHSDLRNRRISVELQLAPKGVVEHALETAQELGVTPARIELSHTASDGQQSLNLLPEMGGGGRATRLDRALALLVVVLTMIVVLVPLQRQSAMLTELEGQVTVARAEAERSLELRKRFDQLSQRAQFLFAEKSRRLLVIQVLAELTRVMPNQAHIINVELTDDRVELHGFAETAMDLIEMLDESPLFEAPEFRSPVTQDRRGGAERFHVSVRLTSQEGG